MIKVNCKDGSKPVKSEYPCLKITEEGRIVLFTGSRTGLQLRGICKDFMSLSYSEQWSEEIYEPYTGTIELSNEL